MSTGLLEYRVHCQSHPGGPWQSPEPGLTVLAGAVAIEFRSVPFPSAADLRAYLEASGWTEWSRGVRMAEALSDEVAGASSVQAAIKALARAEGRSPGDIATAVNALQEAPRGHSGAPPDETGREAPSRDEGSQDRAGASMGQPERDLIRADLGQLLDLLGLGDYARPESPHEVFQQCIREVARLIGQNWKLSGAFSREAAQGPPSGDAGAQPRVSTVAPMQPGAVPAGWVFAAEAQLSLHGRDLLRHVIAGVAPVIAAAERERIALLAEEHGAVYRTCPCVEGRGPHPDGSPALFADLIREEAGDG